MQAGIAQHKIQDLEEKFYLAYKSIMAFVMDDIKCQTNRYQQLYGHETEA